MSKHPAVGLIYGSSLHHLDHIGVICILLGIPLIVTEEKIGQIATKNYPELVVFTVSPVEVSLKITKEYDIVISSLPQAMINQIFFLAENVERKKILSIWCPHGNSDKGHLSKFMEALKEEKIVLAYGSKMIDFLKDKGSFSNLYKCIEVGNFRYQYYQRMKPFYDRLIDDEIFNHLPSRNPTILYAPTWGDSENSSTFFAALPRLAESLPNHYNLIVKLHPNMILQEEPRVNHLIWNYETKENLLFLTELPMIYPLLNKIDTYIGDMSSIGYDFLFFNRPMFFLSSDGRHSRKEKAFYLHRCGETVMEKDFGNIFKIIAKNSQESLTEVRKEAYNYTFSKRFSWDSLKKPIETCYNTYFEEKIDLI